MKRFLATDLVAAALIWTLAACAKNHQSSSSAASDAATQLAAAVVPETAPKPATAAKSTRANCAVMAWWERSPRSRGSGWYRGDPEPVIHVLKFGLSGPLSIGGHKYNGMMPAWARRLLRQDIASVITYIRSSWGNNASAVSAANASAF